MAFTNNVMIVRHELLAKLVRMWKEDRLVEDIDRLPIELSPRKAKPKGRCCVHGNISRCLFWVSTWTTRRTS